MKKGIIISVIIIALAAIVFMIFSEPVDDTVRRNNNEVVQNNDTKDTIGVAENQNAGCSNEEVVFTNAFVDSDKIAGIDPIGALDGGSHGRSYIQVKEGGQTPVYAPTDAVLEYIVYARRGPLLETGEYGLYFRAGCDLVFLFDHLDSLSVALQALAPVEFSESSATGGPIVGYQVKAGELIAYTDGTDMARTFDFLVLDNSKQVEYINSERFEWDQNNFSQCPYDLFTEDLRDEYYSLLPEPNRSDKNCGNPSYDKEGTAAGGWFQGDDKDMRGRWLTFGTFTSYSGLVIRKDGGVDFSVRDYSPSIRPEDMNPGNEVCYDYNGNWAYARLKTADELRVATGSGSCPNVFPESQAETWVR